MGDTRSVVINTCFGGFGLSEAAYERLGELGIPIQAYVEEQRGADGLYAGEPRNEGEVIFDRDLSPDASKLGDAIRNLAGRYWDNFLDKQRDHPLLVQVVRELGANASGRCAELSITEIPSDVEWQIEEYDGNEHIAEAHRTWR